VVTATIQNYIPKKFFQREINLLLSLMAIFLIYYLIHSMHFQLSSAVFLFVGLILIVAIIRPSVYTNTEKFYGNPDMIRGFFELGLYKADSNFSVASIDWGMLYTNHLQLLCHEFNCKYQPLEYDTVQEGVIYIFLEKDPFLNFKSHYYKKKVAYARRDGHVDEIQKIDYAIQSRLHLTEQWLKHEEHGQTVMETANILVIRHE
jgi:hypothetical protein